MAEKKPIDIQNKDDIEFLQKRIEILERENKITKSMIDSLCDYLANNTRNKNKRDLIYMIETLSWKMR